MIHKLMQKKRRLEKKNNTKKLSKDSELFCQMK
jgi:hypothetical protein